MVNSVVIDIKGAGGGTRVPPNNLVLLDGDGYGSPPPMGIQVNYRALSECNARRYYYYFLTIVCDHDSCTLARRGRDCTMRPRLRLRADRNCGHARLRPEMRPLTQMSVLPLALDGGRFGAAFALFLS